MPGLLNSTPGFASVSNCATCNRYVSGPHICSAPQYPTLPTSFPAVPNGVSLAEKNRLNRENRNKLTLGKYLEPNGTQHRMYPDLTGAIPHDIAKTFDYALTNLISKDQSGMKSALMGPTGKVAKILISDFANATRAQQLAVIDLFFDATVMWVSGTLPLNQMYEPAIAVANQSLLTSGQANPNVRALQTHGIGFRCEQFRDLERVRRSGFKPLYTSLAVAEGIGQRVKGTIMDRAVNEYGEMGLFLCNKDAVGETAICVSRNMRGAGKFPTPEMVCDAVICAVKPKQTTLGFDTEQWQIDQRGMDQTALWRPGEKLFPKLGPEEVIAYVRIRKEGGGGEGNYYTFTFQDTSWNWLGSRSQATQADRQYIDAELAALRAQNGGRIVVPKNEDFAV
jgi:hypothetical protein